MPKIQIEVCIESEKTEKYKIPAILKDNSIVYKEKDNELVSFNIKDNILIRRNNEIEMEYCFIKDKETIGKIKIIELNKELSINIKTKEIIKEDNYIKIEYIIENNTFKYSIKILKTN